MDAVVAVLVNGREYSVDDAAYAVASGLHPSTKRNKERGGTWSSRNIDLADKVSRLCLPDGARRRDQR